MTRLYNYMGKLLKFFFALMSIITDNYGQLGYCMHGNMKLAIIF